MRKDMNRISLHIRLLLTAVLIAVSTLCAAQSTGNFTRLRTYTSDDGTQYRDEYVVYDGLGRPCGIVKPRFGP